MNRRLKVKHRKLVKEWNQATRLEILEAFIDNALYGFLGAIIVVAINMKIDLAVFAFQFIYFSFVGKILNRPKYVTDLGKIVIFPVSTTIGSFTGYKVSQIALDLLIQK